MASDVRAEFSTDPAPARPVLLPPVTVAVLRTLTGRRRERRRREARRAKTLQRSWSWPLSVWWDESLGNCRE
ncbi:hypothetical protein [Kineococcus sp. NPDC059986]|uniref:hypothetical protein n=1 Tax=Kineococcus sp. NPDC059986 TaxID=3155538 RepID=UPI00344E1CF4